MPHSNPRVGRRDSGEGKTVGYSMVGNPGFMEAWQDPWCTNWASSFKSRVFSPPGPRMPWTDAHITFWTTHPEERGFFPVPWAWKPREGP